MNQATPWLALLFLTAALTGMAAYQYGHELGLEQGLEADRLARIVETSDGDWPLSGTGAEVREALLLPDRVQRIQRVAELLNRLEPSALEPVRNAYDDVLFELGDAEIILLAEWWASFDPEAAFHWTRHNWESRVPSVVLGVVRAWARIDPLAAYATVGPFDSNERPLAPYVVAIVQGWAESGQPGLDTFMAGLSGSHLQRAHTTDTRRKVRQEGAEASIAWAEALPIAVRPVVFQRLASAIAEIDPIRAAAFAERHLEDHGVRWLPRRVGTRWAKADPQAAMEWLSTLPAGTQRDDGVTATYRRWLRVDTPGAHAWIDGLPTDEEQRWVEPAVALYAVSIALESPREAADLANRRVLDPELKPGAVGNPVRYWLLMDEPAALSWLADSGLPEKIREKIKIVPDGFRVNYEMFHQKN